MGSLKITLVKSTIKAKQDQKATAAALGLRRLGQTVEKKDNLQIRGMIEKISHLVSVEEV